MMQDYLRIICDYLKQTKIRKAAVREETLHVRIFERHLFFLFSARDLISLEEKQRCAWGLLDSDILGYARALLG